jgi:hypothetical protein
MTQRKRGRLPNNLIHKMETETAEVSTDELYALPY